MKKLTKIFTPFALTLLLVASIISCTEKVEKVPEPVAEPTFDMATAKAEIVAANQEFMTFFNAGDSVNLSNLYTQDAKFMSSGAPATVGRDNIQVALSGIIKSGITSANLITVDVWGTEDYLTEEGELSLFVGEAEVFQGKYIVLWKKDEGKWKLFRDIFNSSVTAE